MTIAEMFDASAVVEGAPPAGGRGEVIEDAKKNCGMLIGLIDKVVDKLTGWSLLETLLEPLAGDFNALDSMAQAWDQCAVALGAVGDNYSSLSGQLPGVWTGDASDAAQARLTSIGEDHAGQQEAAELIAEQLRALIEVSEATVEVVASAINLINDIIQELIGSAAFAGIGLVKAAFKAPGKIKMIISFINKAVDALQTLTKAAETAARVIKYVNITLNTLDGALDFSNAAVNSDSASKMDDAAAAGFG